MTSITQTKPGFFQNKWNQLTATITDTKNYITSHKTSCALTLVALGTIAYLVNENQELLAKNSDLRTRQNCPETTPPIDCPKIPAPKICPKAPPCPEKKPCPEVKPCPEAKPCKFETLADFVKPNHWTLDGEENPLTNTFTDLTVCQAINDAAKSESISDLITNLPYKNGDTAITYSFLASDAQITFGELLIHNNCQKFVRDYKSEILNPDLKPEILRRFIVAAAAARNIPLWKDLMSALEKNNATQNNIVDALDQAIKKSIAVLDFFPSSTNSAFSYYGGVIYDAANSLQDTQERKTFLMEIFGSSFMKKTLERGFSKLNDDLSEQKINKQNKNADSLLVEAKKLYNLLTSVPFASKLVPDYKPDINSYPNVKRYVNQDWEMTG